MRNRSQRDIWGLTHTGSKYLISQKKLEKNDAHWAYKKEVLSFLFNGQFCTVRLSIMKANAIASDTKKLLKKPRVGIKKFRSVVGKLRHTAMILPAAKSLFIPINRALRAIQPSYPLAPRANLDKHTLTCVQ